QGRTGEILAGDDHLVRRVGVGKVLGLVDQNDPAGHRERPFGITIAALSPSRPNRVIRSNSRGDTAKVSRVTALPSPSRTAAGSCTRANGPSQPKTNTQCGTLRGTTRY